MPGPLRKFQINSLLLALSLAVLPHWQPASAQVASGAQDTTPSARALFAALKDLAGTWNGRVTTDPANPNLDGPIQVTMRVASHGNVLMHEIAPGGVPEPTLIYLDGDRLTLIHYCEAGNRPRMVARRAAPDQKGIVFDFVDISGSTRPVYLSNFVFTPITADHHTEDWTFTLPNGMQLHAHFDLTRAKAGGSEAGR